MSLKSKAAGVMALFTVGMAGLTSCNETKNQKLLFQNVAVNGKEIKLTAKDAMGKDTIMALEYLDNFSGEERFGTDPNVLLVKGLSDSSRVTLPTDDYTNNRHNHSILIVSKEMELNRYNTDINTLTTTRNFLDFSQPTPEANIAKRYETMQKIAGGAKNMEKLNGVAYGKKAAVGQPFTKYYVVRKDASKPK